MKTSFLIILSVLFALQCSAQTAVDTTSNLDSIMVLANRKISGAKAVKPLGQPATIPRTDWRIGKLAARSEEALLYLPGVHIRQRGPGQIATLQYRGLQGARVAQTWQGIPVSNPQLGTSDANEINLALVDNVELGSPTSIGHGAAVSTRQSTKSPTSIAARYANGDGILTSGQWKGLKVLFQYDAFDFPHTNSGSTGSSIDVNARLRTVGASYATKLGNRFSSSTYFLHTERKYFFRSFEESVNSALRTTTARQLFTFKIDSNSRLDIGGLLDIQKFERGNFNSETNGSSFQPLLQYQRQLTPGIQLTSDNRILISSNTEYDDLKVLPQTRSFFTVEKGTRGMQFEFVAGISARAETARVLFGSAALSKRLSDSKKVTLTFRRLGRLPTLDDLFWTEGGMQGLASEKGWGVSSSSEGKFGPLKITPVLFARRFTNYVLWLPSGIFWRPVSIPSVNNLGAGLDISSDLTLKNHRFRFQGSINYAQLQLAKDFAINARQTLQANDNLPFAPKFTSSASVDYAYRKLSGLIQARYTGRQNTSYNSLSEFDEFAVLRTAVSYKASPLTISLSCDNLTNTILPNDFGLFSPLRRFELTLNYTPTKR